MISAIVTGVGLPMMEECLASINPWPDEMIVVIDDVGRFYSPELLEHVDAYSERLQTRFPEAKILHNTNFGNWQITNQTINIGIKAARNEWVTIIHEDTVWPDHPHFPELEMVLNRLSELDFDRISGVTFPFWQEIHVQEGHQRVPPEGTGDHFGAGYLPTSTVMRKSLWEAFGGFDEEEGIWYDAQIIAESLLRGMTFYHHDMPLIRHWPSKSYAASNYGDGWKRAEAWGNFGKNYEKRYGAMFERDKAMRIAGQVSEYTPPEGWKL